MRLRAFLKIFDAPPDPPPLGKEKRKDEDFTAEFAAPYRIRPVAVENPGCCTSSTLPFILVGIPILTGIARLRLETSLIPTVSDRPPVNFETDY